MILKLNKRLPTEYPNITHAYYYPFKEVMVYLEFGGDFKDISLLDVPEMSELTDSQRRIIESDLATCQELWDSNVGFLEYDDIFPVKSIKK